MMPKESIPFGDAMKIKVAFSNAVTVDLSSARKLISISGQIAFDDRGELVGKGDIGLQTQQCLENIQKLLRRLGGSMEDIIQMTVFLKEMSGLKEVHDIRLRYFRKPYPSSTLIEVKGFVHPDALIEINALAVR